MLFTDHKVCLKQNKELVEKEIKKIKEIQGITILSVGIGSHIDIRELKEINSDERKVMRFGEYTNREIVGKSISHGMLLFGLIQLGGKMLRRESRVTQIIQYQVCQYFCWKDSKTTSFDNHRA